MRVKKRKIVFCTVPRRVKSGAYEVFNEGGSSFPSIGLLILAAIAREDGNDAVFKDYLSVGADLENALSDMRKVSPDWIAISSNTDMILDASSFADEIKKNMPHIIILIGGPHVSAAPQETMEKCKSFDIGVIGEGEAAFGEILRTSGQPRELHQIKGIVFRDGGLVKVNNIRPFIDDLDSIPFPAWDLIDDMSIYKPAVTNYKRQPVFSLMTSRGCFGRCIFCDRKIFGNRVRMHSASYVMDMIRRLQTKYGIREVTFYDDNIVFDKKRLKSICGMLSREKERISWSCNARVDLVDEDTLTAMKLSGCWQIGFGIESGSQKILDTVQKGITVERIRRTAKMMRKLGMSMKGYFIIGSPGETEDTLRETYNLIMELELDDILVEYMTPYPGTELYERASEYGVMKGDWASLNSYEINFIPHGLDEKALKEYFYKYYKGFYLRPGIILKYALRMGNPVKMIDLGIKFLKFQSSGKN